MIQGGAKVHDKSMKAFAVMVLIVEVIMIVLYSVFVRINPIIRATGDPDANADRYPAYQDVNVMMLIGFAFLMSYPKDHSWSAIAYNFFVNSVAVQLYILQSQFWIRVLETGFDGHKYIYLQQKMFTTASYAVAGTLIGYGAVLGRVGPKDLMLMAMVKITGYTLSEQIIYKVVGAIDVGGSMTIHTFGATYGLVVSLFLSSAVKPESKPKVTYNANIFAMIGTLFLWMYWPSFNFGYFANTDFNKTQIISNTILSLTGSCLSSFMTSSFTSSKFTMEHILNATLAGGVVIGAASSLLYHPGAALAIGFGAGIISTLGFEYLSPYLQKKIGLYDTCGINNLHLIPGVIGSLISAVIVAGYAHDTYDPIVADPKIFPDLISILKDPYRQGGIQVAGTFIAMGIAIVCGVVSGTIIKCTYNFHPKQFFTDYRYWQQTQFQLSNQQMQELQKLDAQKNSMVSAQNLQGGIQFNRA